MFFCVHGASLGWFERTREDAYVLKIWNYVRVDDANERA